MVGCETFTGDMPKTCAKIKPVNCFLFLGHFSNCVQSCLWLWRPRRTPSMWRCTAALTLGCPGHPLSVFLMSFWFVAFVALLVLQSQMSRTCQNHFLNGLWEELNGGEFAREHATSWLKDLLQSKASLGRKKMDDTKRYKKHRQELLQGSTTASLHVCSEPQAVQCSRKIRIKYCHTCKIANRC